MFRLTELKMETLAKGFDYKDKKEYKFTDMSKMLFSILKGTGKDPFETVPLDRESRKYFHV